VPGSREHLREFMDLVNHLFQVVNFMNHQYLQLGSTLFLHLVNDELRE
jgi:hypothetical protein